MPAFTKFLATCDSPVTHVPSPTGLFLIDKEPGPTSADVIRDIKKKIGKNVKLGHAGTLDPDGAGLLVVLVGDATRLSEAIMDQPKVYEAVLKLGVVTDTYDAAGKVEAETDPSAVTEDDFRSAMPAFTGAIRQAPPPFSAIKIGGKRAYDLARKGEIAVIPEREAMVYEFALTRFAIPECEIRVKCGKGMYLRSLAHDIGKRLGVGAHVKSLRRLAIGRLIPKLKVGEIDAERWGAQLTDPAEVFEKDEMFALTRRGALNLCRGLPVKAGDFTKRPKEPVGNRTGVLDDQGRLIAVAKIGHGGSLLDRKIIHSL